MSFHDLADDTYAVTVDTKTAGHPWTGYGSANAYFIDGVEAPEITTVSGKVLRFDQSDSSNAGHPLRFFTSASKYSQYTTNVTTEGTPGSEGAYTQIEVTTSTPATLHYQCSNHAYMGHELLNSSYVAPSGGGGGSSSSSYGGGGGSAGIGGTVALSDTDRYYQDHNGKYIRPFVPFTDRFGNQYPANWTEKLTEYQRLKAGIISAVPYIRPYNRTFRHGPDDFKDFAQVVSGLIVDEYAALNGRLGMSDYYAQSGVTMPLDIHEFRLALSGALEARALLISGAGTTANLERVVATLSGYPSYLGESVLSGSVPSGSY